MRKLLIVLVVILFLGCKTDAVESPILPELTVELYNESFDFEDGLFSYRDFVTAFPNLHGYKDGELERTFIEDGTLKATLLANSAASPSGLVCNNVIIPARDNISMEYRVKFQDGFDWGKGGKLPGISGGNGYTGGLPASNGKGWSVRLMWFADGKIKPYVYHYNQPGVFGDTFDLESIATFKAGSWHRVKYYVQVNTEADNNGVLVIWIDGVEVFATYDLCYATERTKHKINEIRWAIFRGGKSEEWWSPLTQYVYIDDVKLNTK